MAPRPAEGVEKAKAYRAKADECERRAKSAHDPDAKRDFEELARSWRYLASLVEEAAR